MCIGIAVCGSVTKSLTIIEQIFPQVSQQLLAKPDSTAEEVMNALNPEVFTVIKIMLKIYFF